MDATTKAIVCEVCDLLTEANLSVALKQSRVDTSRDIYDAMKLREITLRLRFALPIEDWQQQTIDKNEALFDRVIKHAKLDGAAVAATIINLPLAGSVEEREARYEALLNRLETALDWTKWGSKLKRDAEREYRETKRDAYISLTGDTFWYRG